ncbi:restriction endonuclease subunit S [Lysobacter koreensis]|uniref:Restriction endonuclease subunit S n=1 Tax=Lysobacter koreensis TaxID=266122 RepID=A0ABW2YR66_9GAMM
MRAGWQLSTIGEVCEVVNGATPKTSVAQYWGGHHRWITPAEMGKRSNPYVDETARTLTDAGLQDCSAKLLPANSVILSSRAPIGHLVINAEPMATNQGCKGLVPASGVHHKFLYYYLGNVAELLESLGTGATFKELSGGKLKAVEIFLPPMDEQKRIVAILDQAFAGIATAKANSEKNLQNARALFESHLQQVFGSGKEGWVDTTIDRCIRFIDYRGRTPTKTEAGLRLITAKNVKMGFLQRTPMEFVDPRSYGSWMTRGIPKKGDVLFTTEAPLGNVAQLDTDEKVVFAQRVIIMQPDPAVLDNTLLKYLLLSPTVQERIRDKATGATALGIKASLLKKIEISFPRDLAEQQRLVSQLDALKSESLRLERTQRQKLAALDELKQSLLAKAFAGELS